MSKHYAAPEEILYHVGFSAEQLQGATVAVLPGDPGRVEPLAKALGSDASFIASHREYTSWLTKISDTPVLVCSTGMGGPSVAICLEELARMGIKKLIRFGTTGTIQEKVNLGDIIIDKAAVRLDGTEECRCSLSFGHCSLQRHFLAGAGALRQLYRLCTASVPRDNAGMAGIGRAEL